MKPISNHKYMCRETDLRSFSYKFLFNIAWFWSRCKGVGSEFCCVTACFDSPAPYVIAWHCKSKDESCGACKMCCCFLRELFLPIPFICQSERMLFLVKVHSQSSSPSVSPPFCHISYIMLDMDSFSVNQKHKYRYPIYVSRLNNHLNTLRVP